MMRGLTVKQPWAWAIIHGGKDVENRTRSLGPYRGPVAIDAGLAPYEQNNMASRAHRAAHGGDVESALVFGAIIGVADLVDVHEATPPEVEWCGCSAWAQRFYVHHLVLRDVHALAHPIPWRGALGLWTVPDELEARIWEQVAA